MSNEKLRTIVDRAKVALLQSPDVEAVGWALVADADKAEARVRLKDGRCGMALVTGKGLTVDAKTAVLSAFAKALARAFSATKSELS